MSRLALPPEIPAKLARNTLYDVLCIGDSFGIDWTFSIDSVLSRLRLAEDADVRAMHAALNMTEENFDTPSKPKPGAIPTPAGCSRRSACAAHGRRVYFNRMAEAAGHLLWLLVLSSDPAYKPRCWRRASWASSSAVWGERPDTGVLTDAYAIRIVLEAACRTCRDRHGRQGICAFDLVPEFEVPGVTIGDRVQVIRRCSMPDSHGAP
eukprot:tig00001344_g8365.t1